jgi:hypothetical protein
LTVSAIVRVVGLGLPMSNRGIRFIFANPYWLRRRS